MTTNTGRSGGTVIEFTDKPRRRNMADITRLGGRNMRRTLADGFHTIVATFTGAVDLRMIHGNHRHPCCAVVTGLAQFGGVNVYH